MVLRLVREHGEVRIGKADAMVVDKVVGMAGGGAARRRSCGGAEELRRDWDGAIGHGRSRFSRKSDEEEEGNIYREAGLREGQRIERILRGFGLAETNSCACRIRAWLEEEEDAGPTVSERDRRARARGGVGRPGGSGSGAGASCWASWAVGREVGSARLRPSANFVI